MPASPDAERRRIKIPYSEAACFVNAAGNTCDVIEEDMYVNGKIIPKERRTGCIVVCPTGAHAPMLKTEAGWDSSQT